MPSVDTDKLLQAVADKANEWGETDRWTVGVLRQMHALRGEAPDSGSTPWYAERLFGETDQELLVDWDVMSVDFALDVLVAAGALAGP